MVRTPDALEVQLLRLPAPDRARIAEVLLASLHADDVAATPDTEAAWVEESERRLAELKAGTVAGIPADVVFASIARRMEG